MALHWHGDAQALNENAEGGPNKETKSGEHHLGCIKPPEN